MVRHQPLTLTYRRDDGATAQQLLYRDYGPRLRIETAGRAYPFDGDAESWRLAVEALRIRYAALFDPMLAVATSDLEALPHQITAVYGEMLPRPPLRFLLADDPGAGKTMVKELMLRGDLARCLVVAPAASSNSGSPNCPTSSGCGSSCSPAAWPTPPWMPTSSTNIGC